jgi:CheY-like chemotaxis protein
LEAAFDLPQDDGPPPPVPPPPPPRSACILVVDAHAGSLHALARLLRLVGYTVHTAASVAEAHVLAAQGQCDVLIAEIELSDGTGFDLLRDMRLAFDRRHPASGRRLPALALTAAATTADQAACRAAGFDDYVPKPARPAELLQAIERLVQSLLAHPAVGKT